MKKFQFRLQAALELRRRREEHLGAELARSRERERIETQRLAELTAARESAMCGAAEGRKGPMLAEDIQAWESHLAVLEEEVLRQRGLVEMAEAEVARNLADLVVASQETKSLENLRVKHAQVHHVEVQHEEQRFIDELASIRSARGMAGAV